MDPDGVLNWNFKIGNSLDSVPYSGLRSTYPDWAQVGLFWSIRKSLSDAV